MKRKSLILMKSKAEKSKDILTSSIGIVYLLKYLERMNKEANNILSNQKLTSKVLNSLKDIETECYKRQISWSNNTLKSILPFQKMV